MDHFLLVVRRYRFSRSDGSHSLTQGRADGHVQRVGTLEGFTLVEMLTVMGIILVILALVVPVVTSLLGARGVTAGAYQIAGAFDQARTYAQAYHTYVWVGITEEDGAVTSPATPAPGTTIPYGRVIISVVASADGSRYSDSPIDATHPVAFATNPSGTLPASNQVKLVQVAKLIKVDGVHLATLQNAPAPSATQSTPLRPLVGDDYRVGNPTFADHATDSVSTETQPNVTTFNYPLTSATASAQYSFSKAIEFSPQGEASKIVDSIDNGPQKWLEIGLQPTHGHVIAQLYQGSSNSQNAAAVVMIEGSSGRVEIIR